MPGPSNYPGGFANGITIRGLPLSILHPGKVFWVNNSSVLAPGGIGGSNSNDGTYQRPFLTIDYAIGRCTADRGDVIVVMPGHVEVVSAAAGIVWDVAGVATVGLGSGTKRPKISFTTAAGADVDITAANCSFYNLEFQANFADVTAGLDVSGVDGLSFDSCYFTEGGTDLNFVDVIDLATGADDIHFENCKFIGGDAANDAFITGVAHNGFYVKNCYFAANVAQTAPHGLIDSSGNVTNAVIIDSYFRSNVDGALWVDFNGAANSGIIGRCYVSSIDTAGAQNTLDFTGGHAFQVYVSGEADNWGLEGGGAAIYANA